MRTAILLGWSITALLLQGCTYSVYPLLTKENLVHNVDLNGNWELVELQTSPKDKPVESKPGSRDSLKLSGIDGNSTYDFQVASGTGGATDDCLVKIGKVGESLFVELSRADPEGPPLKVGLPVYAFAKLEVKPDEIVLTEIDDRKCREILEKEKLPYLVHLGARNPDVEHTVLLSPTPQLQAFVLKYEKELFTGLSRRLRKQPLPSPPQKKP